MSTQARHCLRLVGVFTITGLLTSLAAADKKVSETPSVRIGLMKSLFRDAPDSLRQVLMEPFRTLTESQTGIKSELETAATAYELGLKLNEKKLQLGVFNGIEFGWAQQDFPRLKPLLIGVNKHRELFAHLLVAKDSKLKDFAELQNQTVAMPRWSRHHCHLFFDRCQQEARRQRQDFKIHVTTPKGTEAALDDLVRGTVQACVADRVALESYQREKPGSYAKLRTLQKSDAFPSAVVAYLHGVLAEDTLARFRAGMKRANETSVGRQLLATSRLTGFEDVPADYQKMVTEIAKLHPAPGLTKKESASGKQPSRHDGHH
jgi:ABC-type phosphate/phosphonate transport system substrate-binding protein